MSQGEEVTHCTLGAAASGTRREGEGRRQADLNHASAHNSYKLARAFPSCYYQQQASTACGCCRRSLGVVKCFCLTDGDLFTYVHANTRFKTAFGHGRLCRGTRKIVKGINNVKWLRPQPWQATSKDSNQTRLRSSI
jgi:hypothetical protein